MNDFTDLSGQTQLVFKDTTIRATYDEKGTPVFCAKDVATVLGYADTVNAIKQHCRGVAFHHPIVDSLGRTQKARFIGEGDMYRLIAHSKLLSAVEFEKWIFEEVLLNPDTIISLANQLKDEQAKVKELTPKAGAWETFCGSSGDMSVADAAKALASRAGADIGRNRLFKEMEELGWVTHCHGYWEPLQYAVKRGYLAVKVNMPRWRPNGESFVPAPTVRVTPKGLDRLAEGLPSHVWGREQ